MTKTKYTAVFKEQGLGLLSLGKPIAEVAIEMEVSESLLYSWRKSNPSEHLARFAP